MHHTVLPGKSWLSENSSNRVSPRIAHALQMLSLCPVRISAIHASESQIHVTISKNALAITGTPLLRRRNSIR